MFIAQLEQMRRYGLPEADIGFAVRFARSLHAVDSVVFPGMPCYLQVMRNGGMPSSFAQYIAMPDGGESYVLYVDHAAERLAYQAVALMDEHGHRAVLTEMLARRLSIDAIALHEVRHRLQEHEPTLALWTLEHLQAMDALIVQGIIAELPPGSCTPREVDARIIEYLYVAGRINGIDDPATAVRRCPPTQLPT